MPMRADTAAILTIIATAAMMALQDAVVKALSDSLTLWQIFVLRGVLLLPVLILLNARAGTLALRPYPLLRAGLLGLMYLSVYAAAPVLDLATIAAGFYTGPLFIALLSVAVLGERLSWRRALGLGLGFLGVLVIMRPGTAAFTPLALLPVCAGFFYACAAVVTRARCGPHTAYSLALHLNVVMAAIGGAGVAILSLELVPASTGQIGGFLGAAWRPVTAPDAAGIVLLALLFFGVGVGLARAYQIGSPPRIATFDYTYLIFAAVCGWVLFDAVPDAPTVAGMLMIAGAGLLVITGPRSRDAPP